jgi:hypothetical protein
MTRTLRRIITLRDTEESIGIDYNRLYHKATGL